ncbi:MULTISPECIES: hypothetical protein [Enterococcus]|uniref:DUF5648 domain-containing protein n=1 Tax=Enterococcus alishanensis TaxID=1303817 RepID=A0ABS6TDT7_9ENTE|nr:hypothetical protein [Enterococcus alishanensis]MBV7391098.1 hypothetical protein [Enterococcus alishanensis]
MEKFILGLIFVIGVIFAVTINVSDAEATLGTKPIYRMYNLNTGEHLFTPSDRECSLILKLGWVSEGVAYYAPVEHSGNVPSIKRLYNTAADDHHYTVSNEEVEYLVSQGWKNDQIEYSGAGSNGLPVYRLYNPNSTTGTHHFTLNTIERRGLLKLGWIDEGVAFKALLQ